MLFGKNLFALKRFLGRTSNRIETHTIEVKAFIANIEQNTVTVQAYILKEAKLPLKGIIFGQRAVNKLNKMIPNDRQIR